MIFIKSPLHLVLPLILAVNASAATEIAFGPVRAQPGESVRLISTSEASDGTVEIIKGLKTTNGTVRLLRERDMSWTFRTPAEDGTLRGMVSIAKISSVSSVTLDGKEEKIEDSSPLNGKMFAMTKSPAGEWNFELDGSIPQIRVRSEIDELTTYLKRRWYPERVVKVGDSWEFDPAWIRSIIEKDLKNTQLIGTMKLRQVRHTPQTNIAVIDVSVRGTGGDFQTDGSETKVQLELSGQVMVNLKTMLDERLDLKGVIVTSSGKVTDSKKVTLPVNLLVTKSFVKGF